MTAAPTVVPGNFEAVAQASAWNRRRRRMPPRRIVINWLKLSEAGEECFGGKAALSTIFAAASAEKMMNASLTGDSGGDDFCVTSAVLALTCSYRKVCA